MGKFRDIMSIVVICLLAVVLLASSAQARPAGVRLQEGLYAEEIEGDLDAAIKIYKQIAADKSAGSRYAAQAMYRLGICYQKKQDRQKAKATFEKLIARFPKEKAIIEKVRPLLGQMSNHDPAALMPPETLVYLEIGSPGKQIETIVNMLKGTPFENPLAAIGAGQESRDDRSPGDMMAALMNPAMMTEFKKVRGIAIGLTGIQSNNPPGVAAIYPGESDALRGMLIAGLSMALQPGEPIAGMQTLRMEEQVGAAYDDNVIIIAQPLEQLIWCVKQYRGVTSEPTLASQNKAFRKLTRKAREQNAVTIWADVGTVFPVIREEMSDEQQLLIERFGDIGNVDALAAYLSIEENGIAVEANIGFKDGHNCLAYDLIRTPDITKAGFEAVPPQAVALVSFALSETEGAGVAGARKAVKKLTGLDVGRELFANIEQITVFAVPPSSASNENVLAKNISPILPCLGLAVTSRNPKRTQQLFAQLLTLTDLVMGISKGEEFVEQPSPTPGKYKIGEFDDELVYCYMGQAGKSTILTLTPEVLQASLSSLKSGKSALSAGPLHEVLSQLSPGTSKLVAINAGGAMGLADVHICRSLGARPDPNRNSLSQLFGQLAQSYGKTTVQIRTNEKPNNFNLNYDINNIPQLGPIFPLLMQIPAAMENPMLCATGPGPADRAMVRPGTTLELSWDPDRDATAHKV
jgi:tetratricopeptide (TPR) repeat protein